MERSERKLIRSAPTRFIGMSRCTSRAISEGRLGKISQLDNSSSTCVRTGHKVRSEVSEVVLHLVKKTVRFINTRPGW